MFDAATTHFVSAFNRSIGEAPYSLERLRLSTLPPPSGAGARQAGRCQDGVVSGAEGPRPARFYWPEGHNPPSGILIYFHGGAFIAGTLETMDSACRLIAQEAHCLTISVDYRLAPEHRFPAGVEDAFAAVQWAIANAQEFGVAPAAIAVGGDSAGGTLATVAATMARDRGLPGPMFQLLIYPGIALAEHIPGRAELSLISSILTPAFCDWAHSLYLAQESDLANPYWAPIHQTNLAGLPPAAIVAGEFDSLRIENRIYADRLRAAGVEAWYVEVAGMVHGFAGVLDIMPAGRQAMIDAAHQLRSAWPAH